MNYKHDPLKQYRRTRDWSNEEKWNAVIFIGAVIFFISLLTDSFWRN